MHYINYTTPQLQLHYIATTAALHHTQCSSCGWGDRCNHRNHSNKHKSNHLSIHRWGRSAIHDSQQPTSPIGFLFWNFRHPLVRYYWQCNALRQTLSQKRTHVKPQVFQPNSEKEPIILSVSTCFPEIGGNFEHVNDSPRHATCRSLFFIFGHVFRLAFPATDECLLLHCIFIPNPSAGISSGKGSIRTIVETFICDGLMMSHMALCCSAPIQNLLTPNHGVQHKQFPEWLKAQHGLCISSSFAL